jgi:DNA-binding transcriptional LysR family regulator
VVVGPEHGWIGCDRLAPADLIEGEWVLREPGSGTRSAFEEALVHLGVELGALRIQLELPTNEAVRAAVEAGMGATAISASVAAPSIEAGLLHQVRFRLPERDFHVLRHRDRYQSHAADALLVMVAKSSLHGHPPRLSRSAPELTDAVCQRWAYDWRRRPGTTGRPRFPMGAVNRQMNPPGS